VTFVRYGKEVLVFAANGGNCRVVGCGELWHPFSIVRAAMYKWVDSRDDFLSVDYLWKNSQ